MDAVSTFKEDTSFSSQAKKNSDTDLAQTFSDPGELLTIRITEDLWEYFSL